MFFSPTLYVSDIWHTSHSDCTLYFARTHCLVHSVCLHARGLFFSFQSRRYVNNYVQTTSLFWVWTYVYRKKAKIVQKKKKQQQTNCFICAPYESTHTVTAFFMQENKNSELPCHFLDFIKHTQTFQHWVSYLHVIPAYWYSTKGNILSTVKKITMKQSKIILA